MYSITKNGQCAKHLCVIDEENQTVSTTEDGLVFDFSDLDVWSKTGDNCTFETGDSYTFNTGSKCTTGSGSKCTTGSGSKCTTGSGSKCTTGSNCQ